MGKHFQQAPGLLRLEETAQAALRKLRDSAPVPYLRERAAALLKVAAGEPVRDVAQTGLLRPRQPDTVYDWLDRYRAAGVAGVTIRPGRGRKPAFSPSVRGRRGREAGGAARRAARPAGVRDRGHPLDVGGDP